MKGSHKFKTIADAEHIVASASSVGDAARQLGVDRVTLWRWMKAGKVPHPGGYAPRAPRAPQGAPAALPGESPEAWADAVKAERELSATQLELVDLARAALALAKDGHPSIRLSAMGRFQGLVKQLGLDRPAEAPAVPSKPAATFTRAGDPRANLIAVK